jgi:DNA-binding transcriptional LysR family regulator
MVTSIDALIVFSEAAAAGSFSAAARKLGRSQSTVSTIIADMEIDLAVALFDRTTRKPRLTAHGEALLANARETLEAHDRLIQAAARLSAGLEPSLSLAISNTYQPPHYEKLLVAFEKRFPTVELECLVKEDEDVVSLVQERRAALGVVAAQAGYPPDVRSIRLAESSELALFVATGHPLSGVPDLTMQKLAKHRELRITTGVKPGEHRRSVRVWSADSYLLLLEMAELGFGWTELPRWVADRFGAKTLKELSARGWPRLVAVDALCLKGASLGLAGNWLLDALTTLGTKADSK